MKNLRIWFKKEDTAKFISHLDMCRLMERAIHKARLPFWYTEGFNPHVFLTINMPISLGYTGLKESMDVKLEDDNFPLEKIILGLNAGLPKDVRIFKVTEFKQKPGAIGFSEYKITIEKQDGLGDCLQELLKKDALIVSKKTKKGMKEIDIKDDFKDMKITENEKVFIFSLILKSTNLGSINPRLFFDLLEEKFGKRLYPQTARINLFDKDMKEFR
ncbi:MAG: TIGR03936 family radical SAM-associated protein [Clostridia bacterium]